MRNSTEIRDREGVFRARSRYRAFAARVLLAGMTAGVLTAPTPADDDRSPPSGDGGPRRLALLVGVNRNQTEPRLRYCCRDAELLRNSLIRYCGFLPGHITMLIDEPADAFNQPSLGTILERLRQLLEAAREDDLVVVYFAGHGVQFVTPEAKDFYFLPQDGSSVYTGIKLDIVRDWLAACPARQKVLIYDACRNDVEITTRSGQRSLAREAQERLVSPAFVTLFACSAGETAAEDAQVGHGVFTRSLAEGLAGAADGNRDGNIDVAEAFAFAYTGTTEWAQANGMRQNPEKKSEGRPDSHIVLARVTPAAPPFEMSPPPAPESPPPPPEPIVRESGNPVAPPSAPPPVEDPDVAAVILAVREDNLRNLERLAAKRTGLADVRTADEYTLLHVAARCGAASVIDFLIRAGVDPEATLPVTRATALHIACQRGYRDVVRALLRAHVRLERPHGTSGNTALHLAVDAKQRAAEIVSLLISAGCEIEAANEYGQTPLHVAARWHAESTVKTLLAYRAEVNARTKRDETPLWIAVDEIQGAAGQRVARATIEALLEGGADPNLEDRQGESALELATRKGLTEIAELLPPSTSREP